MGIKIIQWNCHSLTNKLLWLSCPPFSMADVLVFQESFLSLDKSVSIPGITFYRSDRLGRLGGRLAIAVNNTWSSASINLSGFSFTNEFMGVCCFGQPFSC